MITRKGAWSDLIRDANEEYKGGVVSYDTKGMWLST